MCQMKLLIAATAIVIVTMCTSGTVSCFAADDVVPHIEAIQKVAKQGEGAPAAQKAVQALNNVAPENLIVILKAFGEASPLSRNYFRSVIETIAQKHSTELPVDALVAHIKDQKGDPRSRTLAFELIERAAADDAVALIPQFLNDPSPELRRRAVQQLIDQADAELKADNKEKALAHFQKALSGAVDNDQVEKIVEPLKELGVEVNLPKHFGFLTAWHVIGPFDNREGIGYDAVYPPETEFSENGGTIDLKGTSQGLIDGKEKEVSWQKLETKDDYGIVDVAEKVHPYKGAVMYATVDYVSPKAQTVEIRLGTPNAWKVWVNGKIAFSREEYHRGMSLDQYRVPVKLKSGRNRILLKLCQNEQEQDWAQRYQYQLRISDETGAAVLPISKEKQ